MNNRFSSLEEYNRVLENNQISYTCHSILFSCNQQCFENKDQLLSLMVTGCEYNQEIRKKYMDAIDQCFTKRWIKHLNRNDIEFDQSCLNDDSLQEFDPYVENGIGLSHEGACFLNGIELQVDEIYGKRPYEDVVRCISFEDSFVILQGLYVDVVKSMLGEKMDLIYFQQKKLLSKNIEINYVDPYEVSHWYPRRYIKLDKGYRADISYTVW